MFHATPTSEACGRFTLLFLLGGPLPPPPSPPAQLILAQKAQEIRAVFSTPLRTHLPSLALSSTLSIGSSSVSSFQTVRRMVNVMVLVSLVCAKSQVLVSVSESPELESRRLTGKQLHVLVAR